MRLKWTDSIATLRPRAFESFCSTADLRGEIGNNGAMAAATAIRTTNSTNLERHPLRFAIRTLGQHTVREALSSPHDKFTHSKLSGLRTVKRPLLTSPLCKVSIRTTLPLNRLCNLRARSQHRVH